MTTTPLPSTILLAEDDPLIREVTEQTLQSVGYRVVSVQDGQEAIEALQRVRPDLILSDVRMPRIDGFELLQRVRSDHDYRATPFIIMSAKAETSDQRMGMSLGADDYVTKPYLSADLLKTIEVRLARASLVNDRLRHHQQFLMRVLPHELRTPLSGIIGYADLMVLLGESGDTLTGKDLVDYGQNIGRSGQRLLGIAEDFSLWSWLESAKASGQRDDGGKL
jgi:CheY-like chemotaxis protein